MDGGFTVFGQVIAGMSVVDSIAAMLRWNFGAPFNEVPLIDFDPGAPSTLTEFGLSQVRVNSVSAVPEPGIALLFASGLAILALHRRWTAAGLKSSRTSPH